MTVDGDNTQSERPSETNMQGKVMRTVTHRQPKYHAHGDESTSWNEQQLEEIIDEYRAAFERFQEAGWDVYVLTVEFHNLRGSERKRVLTMARAVVKLYGVVSKKMVGTRWAKGDLAGYQPVGAFFPHLPPRTGRGEGAGAAKPRSRTD